MIIRTKSFNDEIYTFKDKATHFLKQRTILLYTYQNSDLFMENVQSLQIKTLVEEAIVSHPAFLMENGLVLVVHIVLQNNKQQSRIECKL